MASVLDEDQFPTLWMNRNPDGTLTLTKEEADVFFESLRWRGRSPNVRMIEKIDALMEMLSERGIDVAQYT